MTSVAKMGATLFQKLHVCRKGLTNTFSHAYHTNKIGPLMHRARDVPLLAESTMQTVGQPIVSA